MIYTKNNAEYNKEDKWFSYKIGKYTINVRREFEKKGTSVLENVMSMIYDEMEARKKQE